MVHLIGIEDLDGERAIFNAELSDAEFLTATTEGLPNGYFVVSVGDRETASNSERVRELTKLPRAMVRRDGTGRMYPDFGIPLWGGSAREFSDPMANPLEKLKAAAHVKPTLVVEHRQSRLGKEWFWHAAVPTDLQAWGRGETRAAAILDAIKQARKAYPHLPTAPEAWTIQDAPERPAL